MYRATWLLRNGDRVRSRDYLSLDMIEEFTFQGETVIALEGVSALLEAPALTFTLAGIEFVLVWGGLNA